MLRRFQTEHPLREGRYAVSDQLNFQLSNSISPLNSNTMSFTPVIFLQETVISLLELPAGT